MCERGSPSRCRRAAISASTAINPAPPHQPLYCYNAAGFMSTKVRFMRLILASSSPRRQELLSGLGVRFDIVKPHIDESLHDGEALLDYVQRLSREKAEAIVETICKASALVLSADTIVVLSADTIGIDEGGELLGKPRDAADARRMLSALRDRAHQVITAFTLHLHAQAPLIITRHVRTLVRMRDYSDAEIDAYIASGDPFDKAGAYAIQNQAFHPVARIEGSYSNVVGLPIDEVKAALIEIGYPLPELL